MKTDFSLRKRDWRVGPVIYQVIVDRFVPSAKIFEKKCFYESPRILKKWTDKPKKGKKIHGQGLWSHELEFWGGDLESLATKIDYLKSLKIDVLYLNPIFESLTNHKYDTWDYENVDPAFGSRAELKRLVEELHTNDIRVILDGVFNHMGAGSPKFLNAKSDKKDASSHFRFCPEGKSIGWNGVENLPELNLDNPEVKQWLYKGKDSIVKSYLANEKIDGWRLDVAYEFGLDILKEITDSAHEQKSDCSVVGEIWNFPSCWYPAVDGVMNMHARSIILRLTSGCISAAEARALYETMVADSGIEHMLRAWLVLDNHDTPRLASVLSGKKQMLARILQFSLPGAICMYYGSEIGSRGVNDPEQRAAMDWKTVSRNPSILKFHKKLLEIRKTETALRIGDISFLNSGKTFCFLRYTDQVCETIVVAVNASSKKIQDYMQIRDGRIHDNTEFIDLISGKKFFSHSGFIDFELPAETGMILKPVTVAGKSGYTRYKYMS